MRLVKVSKYQKVEGSSFHDRVPDGEAMFHCFGVNFEEFENGPGNFTTAIIERADGTIETPQADLIQFVKPMLTTETETLKKQIKKIQEETDTFIKETQLFSTLFQKKCADLK